MGNINRRRPYTTSMLLDGPKDGVLVCDWAGEEPETKRFQQPEPTSMSWALGTWRGVWLIYRRVGQKPPWRYPIYQFEGTADE